MLIDHKKLCIFYRLLLFLSANNKLTFQIYELKT